MRAERPEQIELWREFGIYDVIGWSVVSKRFCVTMFTPFPANAGLGSVRSN